MLAAVLASFLYCLQRRSGGQAAPASSISASPSRPSRSAAAIAWWSGKTVKMTAMPQMVAIYNGMGGGAAGAIAAVELFGGQAHGDDATDRDAVRRTDRRRFAFRFGDRLGKARRAFSRRRCSSRASRSSTPPSCLRPSPSAAAIVVAVAGGPPLLPLPRLIGVFFGCALVFGILMTLPIGGADMPVVISIYNACTGVAVGLEGYVLQNPALMIAGMVVGAAGTLLTVLMAQGHEPHGRSTCCSSTSARSKSTSRARSPAAEKPVAGERCRRSTCAMPRASSSFRATASRSRRGSRSSTTSSSCCVAAGVSVKFAIHPVAGRMPGQMDVLLAEAGVPYDMIVQLADINDQFATTDVALVIGANDVVNPGRAYRQDVADLRHADPQRRQSEEVYVVKRGQGKGYSGVVNGLFYEPDTFMVYGDAAAVLGQMIEAVKGLGAAAA